MIKKVVSRKPRSLSFVMQVAPSPTNEASTTLRKSEQQVGPFARNASVDQPSSTRTEERKSGMEFDQVEVV